MNVPAQYPYGIKWTQLTWGALLFGACTFALFREAETNDRGLILQGIITLGPDGATTFYRLLASISLLFVLGVVLAGLRRMYHPRTLVLESERALLPYGLFQLKEASILYTDIRGIREVTISGSILLEIHTSTQKYTLAAALLPDKESYEEVKGFLIEWAK